jgi:predicted nuclease of predicted toxin-antitoxin system
MKILIDQNISYRIMAMIQNELWQVEHIKNHDLVNANDFEIFMFARQNKYEAILTLDEDFQLLQLVHEQPPKIIWIRIGNCSTKKLAETIKTNTSTIQYFLDDTLSDCLELFK